MPSPTLRPVWAAVICAGVVAVAGLQGCATYSARPIKTKKVRQRLEAKPDAHVIAKAAEIDHPILRSVPINLDDGISADEAALLAVVMNPQLRADRDERGLARAQLLQAGILPNPTLSGGLEIPTDGNLQGTGLGYSVGLGWDIRSLITRGARRASQREHLKAVDLDIAWKEWQAAQAARLSAVRVLDLQRRLVLSNRMIAMLSRRMAAVQKAVTAGDATVLDASSVRNSLQDLQLESEQLHGQLVRERLALAAALGVPPHTSIEVQDCPMSWDAHAIPPLAVLLKNLQKRRLDLVGLRHGYDSQEASVRAAVLGQFPSIGVELAKAQDTSFVGSINPGVTVDVPIFDHNQGAIAEQRATRQQLYDAYVARLADARATIADLRAQFANSSQRLRLARKSLMNIKKLRDQANKELERGEFTILDVAPLRDRALDLALQVAELRQTRDETAVSLEIASGMYFEPPACAARATPATPSEGQER